MKKKWENCSWKITWHRPRDDFFFAFQVAIILFCIPIFFLIGPVFNRDVEFP